MFRAEVLIVDAVMAIVLIETSMSGSSIIEDTTVLHTSFPDDPRLEYEAKAEVILKCLDLQEFVPKSKNLHSLYEDVNLNRVVLEVSACDPYDNSSLFCFLENESSASSCDKLRDIPGEYSSIMLNSPSTTAPEKWTMKNASFENGNTSFLSSTRNSSRCKNFVSKKSINKLSDVVETTGLSRANVGRGIDTDYNSNGNVTALSDLKHIFPDISKVDPPTAIKRKFAGDHLFRKIFRSSGTNYAEELDTILEETTKELSSQSHAGLRKASDHISQNLNCVTDLLSVRSNGNQVTSGGVANTKDTDAMDIAA